MSIRDSSRSDTSDLTTEHLERAAKGRHKLAVQMDAIFKATFQLKNAAESNAYFISPEQWAEALSEIRREVDGLELHLKRQDERRRGPRTWEKR